jgi:hypothetical protein
MTIEEENYWMEQRYGEPVEDQDAMDYRRMRIRNFHELDQHNETQKGYRILFGIGVVLFYYIGTIFFDSDSRTPGAMFGFNNHTFDQILTGIIMSPFLAALFSLVGVIPFPDKSDEEWKKCFKRLGFSLVREDKKRSMVFFEHGIYILEREKRS